MDEEQMMMAENEFGDEKASLAFSNMLREQLFLQENPPQEEETGEEQTEQPVEAPQTQETAPEQEETTPVEEDAKPEENTELSDLEASLTKQIDDLKSEFEKVRKEDADKHAKELANINKSLREILNAK